MSVTARRLASPELNLIVVTGPVTGEDVDALAHAATTSAVTPDRHTLAIFRPDACLKGMPLAAMARLRRAIRGTERMRGARPDRRIALVCAALADQPLIQVWTVFAAAGDPNAAASRVFRDLAAAAEWLGLSGAEAEGLSGLAFA